ncbi:hypothetical protein EDB83DRAFT_2317167 [Lactarius deliciosus]|nr:hypothetical protein EDB83DRAFT_2317167 [Lactarius deliciosus]
MLESITSGEEFGSQDVEDKGPDLPSSSGGSLMPAPTVCQPAKAALNVLHFFIKMQPSTNDGKAQRVCKLCRETYSDNQTKLTKDVPNYFYTMSTGTSNLSHHLCLIHQNDYDKAVVENRWPYPLSTQLNVASAYKDRTLRNPNLPPFSPSSFLEHLVHFIVTDDQSICVIKCPKFRPLLMVLRETLVDTNIPKCDKMREAVMSHWKKSFEVLKHDLSVV